MERTWSMATTHHQFCSATDFFRAWAANNFLGQPRLGFVHQLDHVDSGRVEADMSFCMRVQNTNGNIICN